MGGGVFVTQWQMESDMYFGTDAGKWGIPAAYPQAMGMQTTTVTLRSLVATSMTKGDKQKKLPATYTIAKLKVMFQTLFGLEVDRQKLVARCSSALPCRRRPASSL